jgi:hypothetical protein
MSQFPRVYAPDATEKLKLRRAEQQAESLGYTIQTSPTGEHTIVSSSGAKVWTCTGCFTLFGIFSAIVTDRLEREVKPASDAPKGGR